MKEQERKFVLKFLPPNLQGYVIKQAYLMFEGNKHLRVRIIDDKVAYLTYKTLHSSIDRTEYEYEIPLKDGIEMFESSLIRLVKTRYKTTFQDNTIDIDIFSNGTRVVEIEFEKEIKSLPGFCGEEVTGQQQYSNIWIANQNKVRNIQK